jgi:hypothetical protein
VVINYLVFLLPMIVNYVTPMAALVAVMVTFGLLQKTSQVVALTASGQSIYRLAVPALMASLSAIGLRLLQSRLRAAVHQQPSEQPALPDPQGRRSRRRRFIKRPISGSSDRSRGFSTMLTSTAAAMPSRG